MTPITECSREERLERALLCIEGLTYTQGECNDVEGLRKFVEMVYSLAHAATARCKTPHTDWLKDIETYEVALKKSNTIDVEKVLCRETK